MPVDKNVKRTPSSSLCLTNLLLHMFVSRSPISLFPVVPRLGITLPDQYVSLCPMSVSHSPISLFPVVSHVGITLPDLSVSRCAPSGITLPDQSVSCCVPCRYHAPRKFCFLLCPLSASRSHISLFPSLSRVAITIPDRSVSLCDPCWYQSITLP